MDDLAQFFLNPRQPVHRRYEILRALYVDRLSAKEAAERFDCSVHTVNAMRRDFKKAMRSGEPPAFFVSSRPGRKPKDNRDELKELILSLRKQNYSILDIQAALDAMGHRASHDFIHRILVEDGFSRLPRRNTVEKRKGSVSDLAAPHTRSLDWDLDMGKTFHSERGIGLLTFLPLLVKLKVHRWIEQARYPETSELNRTQSVLSFLALKLSGYERYSQDDLWAMDRSLGLFAGLNVLPKSGTLSSYSYRVEREMNVRFLRAMQKTFDQEDLFSGLVNMDFTAIPHWGDESVLENNWSGKRRQALKSVQAVLCQDADSGIFCYSDAEVKHRNQAECVLEFVDFWKQGGISPKGLIFASKFTTYEKGYLGLVPSEHSSGLSTRRGEITKAGNGHARRAPIQGAWTYRHPAKVGRRLRDRRVRLPEAVSKIGWNAQLRLCQRYRRMRSRGKPSQVVITAIAREMAGFLWAIARQVPIAA